MITLMFLLVSGLSSSLESLGGELREQWGAEGSRLLATDVLVSTVRQVRALRRLADRSERPGSGGLCHHLCLP